MSNIYLRTGDSFLVQKHLSERKNQFSSKFGSENIFYYPNPEDQIEEIIGTLAGGGLFSNKKLIIINNLPRSSDTPKSNSEKLQKLGDFLLANHNHIDPDTILCLVSPKPDGRTKIYKDISVISSLNKKEYIYSDSIASHIVQENCPNISQDAINHLIYICDEDLWKIYQESYKLGFLNQKITIEDIDNYVLSSKELDPFGLMSYIIQKDQSKILRLIDNKAEFADDTSELLGAIRWTFRIAILYYEASQLSSDNSIIATKTKLSPMQLGSLRKNSNWITENISYIRNKYQSTINLEYQYKTGILPRELGRFYIKNLLIS